MKTLIPLFLLLSGCAAQMINAPRASRSKYAPQNERTRSATVKYLNQGADFVIESRREGAYKQMWTACGGKYKIVSEGPRAEGQAVTRIGNAYYDTRGDYWYITYQCTGAPDETIADAPPEDEGDLN